jgi:hypothetical protein
MVISDQRRGPGNLYLFSEAAIAWPERIGRYFSASKKEAPPTRPSCANRERQF